MNQRFPLLPWLCSPHPRSTGTLVASHNCLVERVFWLFPPGLPPHLDDFPPVNISFVMSMTPNWPASVLKPQGMAGTSHTSLLEATLLVKAGHGQGSRESQAEPLTPTGFFRKCFICKEAIA